MEVVFGIYFLHGLTLEKSSQSSILNGRGDFSKFNQSFVVKVCDKLAYIQLICLSEKAKYMGNWHEKGDIITLFASRKDLPSLPLICVQPRFEQTIVPLLPKQTLQIVTDQLADFDWVNKTESFIYTGFENIKSQNCWFFECTNEITSAETIKLTTSRKSKLVCVPTMYSCNSRCPLINDPMSSCLLYASNIDGFVMRNTFHTDFLKIDKNSPLKRVYSLSRKNYREIKVEITGPCSFITLEYKDNQWLAKA